LAGFFSEWLIFSGGYQSGLILQTIIATLGTALTLGYYLKAFMYVFARGEPRQDIHEAPISMALPMAVLATLIVAAGVVTQPVTGVIVQAWGR
jgi:formate hydrogenlyase subunit 3/multisubunit Na+/H+ antiporter MnhD subunit